MVCIISNKYYIDYFRLVFHKATFMAWWHRSNAKPNRLHSTSHEKLWAYL